MVFVSPTHDGDVKEEWKAWRQGVGVGQLKERSRVELRGADRIKLLNNLCTNDLKRLAVGQGCEAFLLNVKGHIVGHVWAMCGEESLSLTAAPGQAEKLIGHLDRYIIREDVTLHDTTDQWCHLWLGGPQALACLQAFIPELPTERLAWVEGTVGGAKVIAAKLDYAGPEGYWLQVRDEEAAGVWLALVEAGAVACGDEMLEAARIEWGTPEYGRDISDANLPQEVARDALAISFRKGCDLGQETVARIDALGHVNQLLVKLRLSELVPEGTELKMGEKVVGRLTSTAVHPEGGVLALGYVKRGQSQTGTELMFEGGTAKVV